MAFSTPGPSHAPLTGFETSGFNMSRPGLPQDMAPSAAGPIFRGNASLTGPENPGLIIPSWGSSQTFSYDINPLEFQFT